MTITAAADGSSLGNPGPAGWAWYLDQDTWHAGGWPQGTNNQAELTAVLDLLRCTADCAQEPLEILCDSQYVINSLTKWIHSWRAKGWRKADGKPIMNLALIQEIDCALQGRPVKFTWVKGHAGHPLNEAADTHARAVATAFQNGAEPNFGPGFVPTAREDQGIISPQDTAAESKPVSATTAASTPSSPLTNPGICAHINEATAAHDLTNMPVQTDLLSQLFAHEETKADSSKVDLSTAESLPEAERVLQLEQELLLCHTTCDLSVLEALVHPDFVECSTSGQVTTKVDVISGLGNPCADGKARWQPALMQLQAQIVAPGVALVTYESADPHRASRHCSLWVDEGCGYRLRFHQGTPINEREY